MKMFYATLALTIGGNVLYHLAQKSIPAGVHPLVSIVASYMTAMVLTLGGLFLFPLRDPIAVEIGRLNWASLALGLSIVAVELGFLLAYRMGWRISLASVTSNTAVALILLPTSVFVFRERLSPTNALGFLLCVVGLVLVTR
ncbi:MAG TPA: hypothetical protein VLV78_17440 [Thermoanaerobaculia bacterium]|nr:hypothetical protein [Thermoanaerobaculia bacterium]